MITTGLLQAFDDVIEAGGAAGVANFFAADYDRTVSMMPDWDESWFEPIQEKILSGSYSFLKIETDAPSYVVYVFGIEGEVNDHNYEIAFPYQTD